MIFDSSIGDYIDSEKYSNPLRDKIEWFITKYNQHLPNDIPLWVSLNPDTQIIVMNMDTTDYNDFVIVIDLQDRTAIIDDLKYCGYEGFNLESHYDWGLIRDRLNRPLDAV